MTFNTFTKNFDLCERQISQKLLISPKNDIL